MVNDIIHAATILDSTSARAHVAGSPEVRELRLREIPVYIKPSCACCSKKVENQRSPQHVVLCRRNDDNDFLIKKFTQIDDRSVVVFTGGRGKTDTIRYRDTQEVSK